MQTPNINRKIFTVSNIVVSFAAAVISGVLVWWLDNYYQQPQVEYFSRPYYKIDNLAIGNIYLNNSGRKTDKNITITLFTNIDPENFKIVDLTSPYSITNNDNKTIIKIDELKPGEEADITYKDSPDVDDVDFKIVSDNTQLIKPVFEQKWWHLPLPIVIVSGITLWIVGWVLGFVIGRSRSIK